MWRGNGINVLKIAPESAIKFAAYEQAKRIVLQFGGSKERELSIYERFVAGSFAGGISQSVIYPLEVGYLCFKYISRRTNSTLPFKQILSKDSYNFWLPYTVLFCM